MGSTEMKELIAGLQAKDRHAFEQVMAMFKTRIFNYLRVLVHDRDLAEELTQDTFVKVYFKGHTIRTENLKAWIFTIATNLARNEFRRRRIRYWLSLDDLSDAVISVDPTMDDDLTLRELVGRLPDKYRVPLVMKEIDNFSFNEIAEITGRPVGTVKTLVFRGKKRMRDMIENDGRKPETRRPIHEEGLAGVLVNGGSE